MPGYAMRAGVSRIAGRGSAGAGEFACVICGISPDGGPSGFQDDAVCERRTGVKYPARL